MLPNATPAGAVVAKTSGVTAERERYLSGDPRSPHVLIAAYRAGFSCLGSVEVKDDAYWERQNSKIRRKTWRLADQQWWLCFYCDLPMTEKTVTREHIIPRSKGGRGLHNNTAATCCHCNKRKGNRSSPPLKYLLLRRKQYYHSIGLHCEKPRSEWRVVFPNFGLAPDGSSLWAPQYGIV